MQHTERNEREAHTALNLHRVTPIRYHEDQTDDAGIGSVLLIFLAFLGFSLLCLWCAAVVADVPMVDLLREIWRAGQ